MRGEIQSTCVAAEVRPGIHSHSSSAAYSDISASSSYLSIQCFSTRCIRQTKYSSTRVKTTLLYKTHLKNINALCKRTLRSIGKRPRTVVPRQRVRVSRSVTRSSKTNILSRIGVECVGFGSVQAVWLDVQATGRRQQKPRFMYSDPNISQRSQTPGEAFPRGGFSCETPTRSPPSTRFRSSDVMLLISLCVADGCVSVHKAVDKSSSLNRSFPP